MHFPNPNYQPPYKKREYYFTLIYLHYFRHVFIIDMRMPTFWHIKVDVKKETFWHIKVDVKKETWNNRCKRIKTKREDITIKYLNRMLLCLHPSREATYISCPLTIFQLPQKKKKNPNKHIVYSLIGCRTMPGFLLLFIKKEELFLRIGPLSLDTLIYAHIPTIWHPKKKKKPFLVLQRKI